MTGRIDGFDIARTVAIFVMIITNFKLAMGDAHPEPYLEWIHRVIEAIQGKGAATFVVLAGTGLSLASRRSMLTNNREKLTSHRTRILKRAAFLLVVGLLYTTIWPADILHFYCIYLIFGAVFLSASTQKLWISIVALTGGFAALMLFFEYEAGWNWHSLEYTDLWTLQGMMRSLFFNGFHPVVPWTGFLFFFGIAVGFAALWRISYQRGPLEWLMRRVTG